MSINNRIEKDYIGDLEIKNNAYYGIQFYRAKTISKLQEQQCMNINEVLANIAIEKLGGNLADYNLVNPLKKSFLRKTYG